MNTTRIPVGSSSSIIIMAEDDVANMDPEAGATDPLTKSGDVVTPSKVKFTSAAAASEGTGGKGEAAIDIAVTPGYTGHGLSKAEVMMYANDPTWKKIRLGSFILFWLVWLGMLGAAVAVVATTRCEPQTKTS